MSKFLKTLVVGAASGAAAAYFLTTEKGKVLKEKAQDLFKDYQENKDDYHQKASDKAAEYKDLAVQTFQDYKEKWETGEITTESVVEELKTKSNQAATFAKDSFTHVKQKANQHESKVKDVTDSIVESDVQVDDIVIDYPDDHKE